MTIEEKINKIIYHTIKNFEGGYVNNPHDKGGPTNFGITQHVYDTYFKVNSSINDIKNMDISKAIEIYNAQYFKQNKIEVIYPEELWHFVFDCYVQHGSKATGKIIQRSLNSLGESLVVDGDIGNKTIEKISCYSSEDMLKYMIEWRIWLYKQIIKLNPSQKVFEKGWMSRVNWFKGNKLWE